MREAHLSWVSDDGSQRRDQVSSPYNHQSDTFLLHYSLVMERETKVQSYSCTTHTYSHTVIVTHHTLILTLTHKLTYNMNSTKVQNPRRNSYGCRHYTMHCLTLNSYMYQCILRMRVRVPRVRVPRCPSRPLPVSRLFHAGCTSS